MSDSPSNRFSIASILVLTTGAAIGLSLLRIAHASGSIPVTIGYVVYGFYCSISGMTIAALPLILWDRVFRGVTWGIGTHYLFVSGCSAAIFMPMIVTKWALEDTQFEPWHTYARLLVAHDPGTYALEAFYHMWPVVAFLLFIAVLVGAANRQWYLIRGYWADGIGIWCMLAWSIPFPFVIWGFAGTYLR